MIMVTTRPRMLTRWKQVDWAVTGGRPQQVAPDHSTKKINLWLLPGTDQHSSHLSQATGRQALTQQRSGVVTPCSVQYRGLQ